MSASFDLRGFPHVFDNIINLLPWAALASLRGTSKAMSKRIDAILFRHVVFHVEENPNDNNHPAVAIVDPYYFRRIPGLQWAPTNDNVQMRTLTRLAENALFVDVIGVECSSYKNVTNVLRASLPGETIVRVYLNPNPETARYSIVNLGYLEPTAVIYATPVPPQDIDYEYPPSLVGVSPVQIYGIPSRPEELVILVRKPEDLDAPSHPLRWQPIHGIEYDYWSFIWSLMSRKHVKILIRDDEDRALVESDLHQHITSSFTPEQLDVEIVFLSDYCQANSMTSDQIFAMTIKPGTPLPPPRSWTDLARRTGTATLTPILDEEKEENEQ